MGSCKHQAVKHIVQVIEYVDGTYDVIIPDTMPTIDALHMSLAVPVINKQIRQQLAERLVSEMQNIGLSI